MTREITVSVPLPRRATMSLLMQAAESLQHQVVEFDADAGRAEIRADFSPRAMSTFRISADAQGDAPEETALRLTVRPGFKMGAWTGFGQSQRVAWRLIGRMQEIMDPQRYRQLEDDVLPSRRSATRR